MTLDLITLNNHIVSLRAPIAQAKVHIIHHLTRQIRKLREKKGSEEQQKKNGRKADRFQEEIKLIKETGRDDLGKFVVRNKKKLEQVVDKTDDLKSRAFVRIASHGAVNKAVEDLRSTHTDWEGNIQSLLAKLGRAQDKKSPGMKLKKAEKLKKRGKEMQKKRKKSEGAADAATEADHRVEKEKKPKLVKVKQEEKKEKKTVKSKSVVKQKVKEEEAEEESSKEGSDSEKEFVTSLRSIIEAEGSDDDAEFDDDQDDEEEDSGEDYESDEEEDSEDDQVQEHSSAKKVASNGGKIFKREGVMEVRSLNMDASEDEDDEEEEEEESEIPVTKQVPKGSFFLGGQSESEESDGEEKGKADGKSISGSKIGAQQRSFIIDGGRGGGRGGRGDGGRGRGGRGGQGERQRMHAERGGGGFASRGAERGRFQQRGGGGGGRFDSGRGGHERGNRGFRGARGSFSGRGTSSSQNLHPSWQAKRQAQNSGIAAGFQGKKMKFDDGKDNNAAAAGGGSEKLHPSWAAKKQKQDLIKPFQGKKTVF